MSISPPVASWFTVGADVPQPEFLAWAASVQTEVNAVSAWIAATGNVGASKLANNAVETAKIADGAVTRVKIADAAVNAAKLDSGAVVTTKLSDDAVTNAKLADMAALTLKGVTTAGSPQDLAFRDVSQNMRPADSELAFRRWPFVFTDFMDAGGVFVGSAVAGGNNSTAPPAASLNGDHPGAVTLNSVATANSGFRYSTSFSAFRIAGGEQFDAVFYTGTTFTNVLMRWGFHDANSSTDATDGAYFELNNSGAVVGKNSNNGTRTTSPTIATLAVNTYYHARVTVNPTATQATFEIFNDAGALLGTQTVVGNLPTGSGRETAASFIATNNTASAALLVTLDYLAAGVPGRTLARGATT